MATSSQKENWNLENTYSNLPKMFYQLQNPIAVAEPKMVCFNKTLINELGLSFLTEENKDTTDFFSGNTIPEGTTPLAQAYAGHQFGHFNMLGDGRAILLGEQKTPNNKKYDIQLKGSGRTPYSRRGDGRATLYSMLREYLISEAMFHLGIPTTRSLAVVSTGEEVYRQEVHQGGILTRVASSHIRFGTFEYAWQFGSNEDIKALTDYTINRHYPEIKESETPPLELFKVVMKKQIDLVVEWMRVGFIHGVMNTDNMSITGETIDYGPCAFMNTYKADTVFSSIDTQGRYAYSNQPRILHWNLVVFANALIPIISEDQEKAVSLIQPIINNFQTVFSQKWYAMMYKKLGILNPQIEDKKYVHQLLDLMEEHRADYTQVFIALQLDKSLDHPLFELEEFEIWKEEWNKRRSQDGDIAKSVELMKHSNPTVIPRNELVEEALNTAAKGDMTTFNELLNTLSQPYSEHPDEIQFPKLSEGYDECYQTFCGT